MKHFIVLNAGPRKGWNTDLLLTKAAEGIRSEGADAEIIDLYRLDKFTGCVSCFGCKTAAHLGHCVCRDGLKPVLEKIDAADGLVIGSPNYLGEVTSVCRALFERLIFQRLTYKKEPRSYAERSIPTLFILTHNAPDGAYDELTKRYAGMLSAFVGPTKTLTAGATLQVNDYGRYGWDMFDPEERKARRETVFPGIERQAFELGAAMARGDWA